MDWFVYLCTLQNMWWKPWPPSECDLIWTSGLYRGNWASLVAQTVKNLPAMWETWVRSLGQKDPLEKETTTHSSILAWRIPRTEEPEGWHSMGSQRVGPDWKTNTHRGNQVSMSLTQQDWCPYRNEKFGHRDRHTEGETMWRPRGRRAMRLEWHMHKPRNARDCQQHQKIQEASENSSLKPSEKACSAADTDFRLFNSATGKQ